MIVAIMPSEAALTASAVLIAGVISSFALGWRLRTPIDPAAMLLVVVLPFFVAVPLLQLYVNEFSVFHESDPQSSFIGAAVLATGYVLAFVIGASVLRLESPTRRTGAAAADLDGQPLKRARGVVILFLAVGAFGWIAYFSAMGGLYSFLDNLKNKTQLASGLGYVLLAANLFQVGALLATVFDAAGRRVLPRIVTYAMLGIAFSTILLTGARSRGVMYLIVGAVALSALGRSIGRLTTVGILVIGSLVIFVAGEVRSLGMGKGAILDKGELLQALDVGDSSLSRGLIVDYGHFDRLSLVHEYVPDRLPFQWGTTLAAVATFPVPRTLYPNKPLGSGPLLANAFRPGAWDLDEGWTSGITATIVGELFLNFSWPGVLVGGALIGLLSAWAYSRYVERQRSTWDAIKYAIIAVLFLMAGTLGEWYGTIIFFSMYCLPVYLAAWYCSSGTNRTIARSDLPG